MANIKVLQIIDQLGGGGAERVVVEISAHLPKDYEILVCATREQGNFAYCSTLDDHHVPYVMVGRRSRFDINGFWRLRKLIQEFNPDIVHTHKFGSNVWGRLLRVTTRIPILICHEHSWSYSPRLEMRVLINRTLAPLSDAIIAVSEADRRNLIHIEKLPADKIVTIYNGIDFSRLDNAIPRSEFRSKNNLHKNAFVAAMIGNLLPPKGHEILLEAIKLIDNQLDNFNLIIAGEGKLDSYLKQRTVELGLQKKVNFLGYRRDITSILNAVDLVIMPSLSEGHPIVLLEAMGAGRMVIAAEVGGIPEVIKQNETGILVPPGSPEELADSILKAIKHPDVRGRIGRAASKYVHSRFSIDKSIEAYVSLYENLLSTKTGRF